MRKEVSLPVLARVLGVGAIGLAAACGGERVANNGEVASQPDSQPISTSESATSTPEIETLTASGIEQEQIPQGPNLFPDPSFESGDWRNNWVIAGKIITQGGYEETPNYLLLDRAQAHSGTSSLRLTFFYDVEDEYSSNCSHTTWRFNGVHGFTFNSEIRLSPGFYEIGVWLKASQRIEDARFSMSTWLLEENSFGLGSFGVNENNWPNDWQKISAAFQVTDEIAQLTFRPSFNVGFSPARLSCGSQVNIWFDDVFLVPVQPPGGIEVHVLNDPLAFEKFVQSIVEKSRPLVERARILAPEAEYPGTLSAGGFIEAASEQDNIKRMFDYIHKGFQLLVGEYRAHIDSSQPDAGELFNLARDVCFFMKENFPDEFETFTHLERYYITNNPNCEIR